MRLRLPDLLTARGMTAYQLHKAAPEHISMSTAYRLARGEWKCLSEGVLNALCDALDCEPGDLFERTPKPKRR